MQREMAIFVELPRPVMAPLELVKLCRHRLDAIRLCVQLSHQTNENISESLGIDKGHWTRIMQGQAHFPDAKSIELMWRCGNFAPLQYEAWMCKYDLVEQAKDQRIKELELELSKLKAG